MGYVSLPQVVDLLSAGGVRAEAAFPAERITRILGPVAAVSLEEVNQEKSTVTVLVEIFGPKESGGYACQQKALTACTILADAGAVCKQGSCTFVGKSNVFRVRVKAEFFTAEKFTIVVGDVLLPHACGFSAGQKTDFESGDLQGVMWEVTVEEFFPWGVQDAQSVTESFQLDFCCKGKIERYEGCTWTEVKRVAEQNGIRQVRKARAMNRIYTQE